MMDNSVKVITDFIEARAKGNTPDHLFGRPVNVVAGSPRRTHQIGLGGSCV
jgi:hypothetical protein